MSSDTFQTTPGSPYEFTIKSHEGSFVSLLGVDQSVKLLGSGNDIDLDKIQADLKLYSRSYSGNQLGIKYSDLEDSNAFVITNVNLNKTICTNLKDEIELGSVTKEDDDQSNVDETMPEVVTQTSKPRKFFPETWIFKDLTIDASNGYTTLSLVVPDTITTFVISAFSLHPNNGLAIAQPIKIKVFKEFFLKLYIPSSIRLNEVLKVGVSVFNYVSKGEMSLIVTVKMTRSNEDFEFVDLNKDTCKFSKVEMNTRTKTVNVPNGNGESTFFYIRASKVKDLTMQVEATSGKLTDSVEKHIKVKREGIKTIDNQGFIIDKRAVSVKSHSFKNFVNSSEYDPNSVYIEACIIGSLMDTANYNLNNLVLV